MYAGRLGLAFLGLLLFAVGMRGHSAELLDDFSEGGWKQSNAKAPATVTAEPGKLILKDHPGGEVTWGSSMSKAFKGMDLEALQYLVIKVNRLTGAYQAKLAGRGKWGKKSVCRGSDAGLVVVDIGKATRWPLGKGNLTVMLYTTGDGSEVEYGFVKFTDTLTGEERKALTKKQASRPSSLAPVKAGLDALAARVGMKPFGARAEDGERTVYTDPVTGRTVWRLTDHPAVERHVYYDILAWNANGSTVMWVSRRAGGGHWLMDADGTNYRPLPGAADGGMVKAPHWCPQRPHVMYFARADETRTTVYTLDARDGAVVEVVSVPITGRLGERVFSELPPPHPDGRHFLMRWGGQDRFATLLVVADAETGKHWRIEPGMPTHRVRFTKHSDLSVFVNSNEDPDNPGVRKRTEWVLALDGTRRRLPEGGGHPDWSPDGAWLGAFGSGGIWLISHDGAVRKELVHTDAGGHGGFSITTGRYHVSDAPRSGPFADLVYVVELASGLVTPISYHGSSYSGWASGVPDPEATHPAPICSPDETKIIYDSDLMGQPDVWAAVWKRPGAPRSVRLAEGKLSWEAPELHREIETYTVYREQAGDWMPVRGGVTGTAAADVPTGCRLAVAAREWSGLESHLAIAGTSIRVRERLAPAPVTAPTVSGTGVSHVDLAWEASPELALAHYNVYAADSPTKAPCQGTLVGSPKGPRFLDWGLQPGADYWYRVTVMDAQGNESLPSPAVKGTTGGEAGPPVLIEIEAETGECEAPMGVAVDDEALGAKCVQVPIDFSDEPYVTEGYVRYRFTVPRDALYIFWARSLGPDGESNSFFLSLDGSRDATWGVPSPRKGRKASYTWQRVPGLEGAPLAKGAHELVVKSREDGTRLDKIVITTDFGLTVTD